MISFCLAFHIFEIKHQNKSMMLSKSVDESIQNSCIPALVGLSDVQVTSLTKNFGIEFVHDIASLDCQNDFDTILGCDPAIFAKKKRLMSIAAYLRAGGKLRNNLTFMEVVSFKPTPVESTVFASTPSSCKKSISEPKSVNDDMATRMKQKGESLLLDDQPPEIHKRICDYLVSHDAISYSTTCKKIHTDLDLATMTDTFSYTESSESGVLSRQHWIGEYHDKERVWFDFFPNILSGKDCIHSVRFDCEFVDQGWGNRKSYLCIRENDLNDDENPTQMSIASRDVIVRSHTAEHHETSVHLKFYPKPGKQYTMCYFVGGGGGHELFVSNAEIHYLMYYNDGRAQVSKLFQKEDIRQICERSFGLSMFKSIIESFIQKDEHGCNEVIHASLRETLQKVGFDMNDVKLLQSVKRFIGELENFRSEANSNHHYLRVQSGQR